MKTFNIIAEVCLLFIHELFICLGWCSRGSSGKRTYSTTMSNLSQFNILFELKCFINAGGGCTSPGSRCPRSSSHCRWRCIRGRDRGEQRSSHQLSLLIYFSLSGGRCLFQNVFQFNGLYYSVCLLLCTQIVLLQVPLLKVTNKKKSHSTLRFSMHEQQKHTDWLYTELKKHGWRRFKNSIQAAK